MKDRRKKESGWMILNSRNVIEVSRLIGTIILRIEKNKLLGKQKIRISKKNLHEAYELLDRKSQRIRK